MTINRYANQYCTTTVYSFFGGRVYLEFEKYHERKVPYFLLQFGGDHLVYKSLSVFNRSLTFGLFPTD